VLTEGNGIPIGIAVSGANTHDMRLTAETLASVPIAVPDPAEVAQHLCLDKGYDYEAVRTTVNEYGYTAHIKSRGAEEADRRKTPKYRARRWVVERTHSWMNRFRRLLIRWEKKADNYLAMVHFASAYIAYSAAGVLG
jgi:transposase